MAATWWNTQGSLAMLRNCSRATDSICPGSAQARTSTLSPRMRCMRLPESGADALCVALALGVRLVFRPRPEEPPQPVSLAARDDVHVQVGHALRDLRVHRDEAPVGGEARLHGAG